MIGSMKCLYLLCKQEISHNFITSMQVAKEYECLTMLDLHCSSIIHMNMINVILMRLMVNINEY